MSERPHALSIVTRHECHEVQLHCDTCEIAIVVTTRDGRFGALADAFFDNHLPAQLATAS